MNKRKLIVVTLEGLATSALGCYGSSWNATPTIDGLASVGCVWDQCIAPNDDPLKIIQQWMSDKDNQGRHWSDQGRIELICDDSRLIELGANRAFDRTSFVDALELPVDQPAEDLELTAFGQLVATAIDRGRQSDPWSLLWLHSRFLTECWDAPRGLIEDEPTVSQTGEPSDSEESELLPRVFQQTTPPRLEIDQQSHPDLVTSWMTTYGHQVQLIDDLVGLMLQSLDASNTVVLVAGTSGFSLGQNGWIGHRVGPLRSCHARVPLIVGCDGPLRCSQMTTADIVPSLIGRLADASLPAISPESWIDQDQEFEPLIVTQGDGQMSVTTSHWFLVCEPDQQRRLFLKPDDIEDFNDISRLRPDVTEQLIREVADS